MTMTTAMTTANDHDDEGGGSGCGGGSGSDGGADKQVLNNTISNMTFLNPVKTNRSIQGNCIDLVRMYKHIHSSELPTQKTTIRYRDPSHSEIRSSSHILAWIHDLVLIWCQLEIFCLCKTCTLLSWTRDKISCDHESMLHCDQVWTHSASILHNRGTQKATSRKRENQYAPSNFVKCGLKCILLWCTPTRFCMDTKYNQPCKKIKTFRRGREHIYC